MAQMTYGYETEKGLAGGIFDIAPMTCNSKVLEGTGIHFGYGVVAGTAPATQVKLPTATTDVFAGVVVHKAHEEENDGTVVLKAGEAVSVMSFGHIWVRVDEDATIKAGEAVYLIVTGETAGQFTNTDNSKANLAVSAKFLDAASNGIAPIAINA